ncbi:MAG TPA: 4'-phosphopantetheinyl transferase superfamily protein [Rhodothermales bacterium]|nr:4'-phosphopantetheinyl transferase superfamily protein [Rhodothermales bacterium]
MKLPDDIAIRWETYDPARAEEVETLLSAEEQARLAAYTLGKRRREFALGRAAARTLLAERLGYPPADIALAVTDGGCVDVVEADLHLSIAHSGEHAVAAVAERIVGIDLERIQPRHPELPRFILHPDEYDYFEALPLDATRAPILYWTLKEATLKALRTGFRLSPKKLQLAIDLAAQSAQVSLADGRHLSARFEEQKGCYVAVAFVDG